MCELTKECKNCKEIKCEKDFSKNKSKKDGLDIYCKLCLQLKAEKLRSIPKILPKFKVCKECHLEKSFTDFHKTNSSVDGLSYTCKPCTAAKNTGETFQKKALEYQRLRRLKLKRDNPELLRNRDKIHNDKAKEYRKNYGKSYIKNRRKTDEKYRLLHNMRLFISGAFRRNKDTIKTLKTLEILDCTIEYLKAHVESQFENWMSWGNYGSYCDGTEYNCSWCLDHIIPISYANTEEEMYTLNHWSNFQPLCCKKNRDKSATIYPLTNLELNFTIL